MSDIASNLFQHGDSLTTSFHTFSYYTKLVAKQRPRLSRHGIYTPSETKNFEKELSLVATSYMKKEGLQRGLKTPVYLKLCFGFAGKKKAAYSYHVKRPDLDNLTKSVKDGLNGIVYYDDSYVVKLEQVKCYIPADKDLLIVAFSYLNSPEFPDS